MRFSKWLAGEGVGRERMSQIQCHDENNLLGSASWASVDKETRRIWVIFSRRGFDDEPLVWFISGSMMNAIIYRLIFCVSASSWNVGLEMEFAGENAESFWGEYLFIYLQSIRIETKRFIDFGRRAAGFVYVLFIRAMPWSPLHDSIPWRGSWWWIMERLWLQLCAESFLRPRESSHSFSLADGLLLMTL